MRLDPSSACVRLFGKQLACPLVQGVVPFSATAQRTALVGTKVAIVSEAVFDEGHENPSGKASCPNDRMRIDPGPCDRQRKTRAVQQACPALQDARRRTRTCDRSQDFQLIPCIAARAVLMR